MVMLVVQNLHKHFGGLAALDGASFEVAKVEKVSQWERGVGRYACHYAKTCKIPTLTVQVAVYDSCASFKPYRTA